MPERCRLAAGMAHLDDPLSIECLSHIHLHRRVLPATIRSSLWSDPDRSGPADASDRRRRHDSRQVELNDGSVHRIRLPLVVEHSLRLVIRFDALDERLATVGQAKIADRLRIDGEVPIVSPYSGTMLPIVAQSTRESIRTLGPKNSTSLPKTPFCARCCRIDPSLPLQRIGNHKKSPSIRAERRGFPTAELQMNCSLSNVPRFGIP